MVKTAALGRLAWVAFASLDALHRTDPGEVLTLAASEATVAKGAAAAVYRRDWHSLCCACAEPLRFAARFAGTC